MLTTLTVEMLIIPTAEMQVMPIIQETPIILTMFEMQTIQTIQVTQEHLITQDLIAQEPDVM
jgi:hypothetical protein